MYNHNIIYILIFVDQGHLVNQKMRRESSMPYLQFSMAISLAGIFLEYILSVIVLSII